MLPTDWLELLRSVADAADELALRFFLSADLHVEHKPDRTLVTQADRGIEDRAREIVEAQRPGLPVFGEEAGGGGERGETRLIIDPIDATSNFVRGIPVFATLLGVEEGGEVTAGLISAPALQRRWHAARGDGAWQGKRRLRVSGIAKFGDAQMFHGSVAGGEARSAPPGALDLMRATSRQRGFGDFWQHCLVSEGAGEIALDPIVAPWDIAPLQVIVEEAGGRATTLAGERDIYGGSLVSSNGLLHDEVLARLRG